MRFRAEKLLITAAVAGLLLCACASAGTGTDSPAPASEARTEKEEMLEKEGYYMKQTETENGKLIDLSFAEKEYHENGQPFRNVFDNSDRTIEFGGIYRANIEYTKRAGGTYVYSNNPEMLASEDIGKAILRTKGLTGDCIFTYEHSNRTGASCYFGYRLRNEGDTDVTVTVTNLGFQIDGEWLGQRSWSDYFNYRFELPEDYFLAGGGVNPIYIGCDYVDYTPIKRDPVSFTIPAGEFIYVLGGTSADAYGNASVFGTADKPIQPGKCSNAVVKFNVSGGSVTGTFYCYTDPKQIEGEKAEQGFITKRYSEQAGKVVDYSKQYKGYDPTAGLIESDITFVVDDSTPAGRLPVKYTKYADPAYASKNEPYNEYRLFPRNISDDCWLTSLNPNNCDKAIGTDMMVFNCVDTDGNPVLIDTEHADSSGSPANIGNWMVQYTDNFTLVNIGEKERTFTFFKRGNGMLFTMARDEQGDILCARALTGPYSFGSEAEIFPGVDRSLLVKKNGRLWFRVADGRPYCDVIDERSEVIKITVAPNSVRRMSIDAVILGNSNGGINHWVVCD